MLRAHLQPWRILPPHGVEPHTPSGPAVSTTSLFSRRDAGGCGVLLRRTLPALREARGILSPMRPRPRRPPFPLAARRQPTLPRGRLIAFAKVARHDCSLRCRCQLKIFWGLSLLPTSAGGGAPHALTAAGGRSAMNAAAAAAAESLSASPVAPLPDARGTVGCCTPTEARAASVRRPGVHANWATGAGLDTAVIVVVIWVIPADRHNRAPARSRSKKARSRAAESAEG